jgi:bifunctional DNA primase/polymerase-like protein
MTAAEIALGAALALGLPAFPARGDKAPACPHGYRDALADAAGLRELWRRHPGPLVGMTTGDASGSDVLDIDAPRHPEAAEWWHRHQQLVQATRIHLTRSGGLHVLFRHARGLRRWAGRPVPGSGIARGARDGPRGA